MKSLGLTEAHAFNLDENYRLQRQNQISPGAQRNNPIHCIFTPDSKLISGTLQQLGSHLSSPSPILIFNNHYLIILFKFFLFSYFMAVYNEQFLHNHFCHINISTLSLIFPQFCLQRLQKSFLHFHCKRGAAIQNGIEPEMRT